MARRNGLQSVALGGLIALALSSSALPRNVAPGKAEDAATEAKTQPLRALAPAATPKAPEAKENEQRKDREEWRSEESLSLQREAAKLGRYQFYMGLAGLVGLGLTVLFAGFAWREAAKAAQAAHDTLVHSDAVSKAELRPWLKIDVVPYSIEVTESGLFSLRCDILCQNVGSTVARSVSLYWDYELAQDGFHEVAEEMRKRWWEMKADNGNVVMPGEVATIPFSVHLHVSLVPWKGAHQEEHIWPRIAVAAFYKSDVDPEWKRSFRNFSIGNGTGELGVFGIPRVSATLTPPTLTAKSYGLGVAT